MDARAWVDAIQENSILSRVWYSREHMHALELNRASQVRAVPWQVIFGA